MAFKGPFQPKPFYDSMIPVHIFFLLQFVAVMVLLVFTRILMNNLGKNKRVASGE